jgi:hypothetical protein
VVYLIVVGPILIAAPVPVAYEQEIVDGRDLSAASLIPDRNFLAVLEEP